MYAHVASHVDAYRPPAHLQVEDEEQLRQVIKVDKCESGRKSIKRTTQGKTTASDRSTIQVPQAEQLHTHSEARAHAYTLHWRKPMCTHSHSQSCSVADTLAAVVPSKRD